MWLRRFGNGLGARSAIGYRAGRAVSPSLDGVVLRCPTLSNAWTLALQITGGEYDYPGFVPTHGWQVLDIGANVGIFSLLAARRGAMVQAYEASSANFECLVHNVQTRGVDPHHAAVVGVRPVDGVVELWLHDERPSRHTLLGTEIVTGEPLVRSEVVPAVALSDLLRGRRFDLVKLDVEGAEFAILQGTDRDLLRCADRWLVEVHGSAGEWTDISALFEAECFNVSCHLEPGSDRDSPPNDVMLVATRSRTNSTKTSALGAGRSGS